MTAYIVKRLFVAIPTLLIISFFVFSLQKLLPGDPILAIAGEERDPVVLEQLREYYHLNDPFLTQYARWLGGVLHGDLGFSFRSKETVVNLIAAKLPVTFQLAVMAMFLAVIIGIPFGVFAAVHQNRWIDYLTNFLALTGLSIPNFWLGIMLMMLVAVSWQLLPASGYESLFVDSIRSLQTTIMPAFVLGTGLAASIMRHTRSSMIGVLKSDYIRTARAKGLPANKIIWGHSFRNALLPVVTICAVLFGELLAGAVLTEQIFTIPGFGKLIVDSVFTRDYAVVQGVVMCTAIIFIGINLLADIIYALLNPRLRHTL